MIVSGMSQVVSKCLTDNTKPKRVGPLDLQQSQRLNTKFYSRELELLIGRMPSQENEKLLLKT